MKKKVSIMSGLIFLVSIVLLLFILSGSAADNFCLKKGYDYYLTNFMSDDGRIIDYERSDVTTSEGQSYIMYRSLIMDDKKTFDLTYFWAKNNLQQNGKIFGWLWGRNEIGEYKILDNNSASDADVDIATALILAYEKWGDSTYLEEGLSIIKAIWDLEIKRVDDYLVLMPGYKQAMEEEVELNPSYFSPYSFKLFHKYDEVHDWNLVTDSSYLLLKKVMGKTSTGLPPNWFSVDSNGHIVFENSERSDFSYDAIRVFARIYLDYKLTADKRAYPILSKSKFFIKKWQTEKTLYTNYKIDGSRRNNGKYPGSIAVLLPVITLFDKNIADAIYKRELEPYVENSENWKNKKDYYSKNLVWFGLYLYEKNIKGCDIKSETGENSKIK